MQPPTEPTGKAQRLLFGPAMLVALSTLFAGGAWPSEVSSAADPPTAYREVIPGTELGFDMAPIPGGEFWMGSEEGESGRRSDEGPRHRVEIEPFWMATTEVTWDLFHRFMRDQGDDSVLTGPSDEDELSVDAVSRPTQPYVPMDFGMGVEGYPAISMTQFAARHFTKWLSRTTGRFYRLPSEAEWEYACRSGQESAFSFGDDPSDLGHFAWHAGNSGDGYRPVGSREPNRWGIHDLHGNVAEWTLDQYQAEGYGDRAGSIQHAPVVWPTSEYRRVARGGSYQDDAADLRCAARKASSADWKMSDPQFPQSIWYLTDAKFVGLRVVRPVQEPSEEEKRRAWDPDVPSIQRILERQRSGDY